VGAISPRTTVLFVDWTMKVELLLRQQQELKLF